jgi:hypothetical protein
MDYRYLGAPSGYQPGKRLRGAGRRSGYYDSSGRSPGSPPIGNGMGVVVVVVVAPFQPEHYTYIGW